MDRQGGDERPQPLRLLLQVRMAYTHVVLPVPLLGAEVVGGDELPQGGEGGPGLVGVLLPHLPQELVLGLLHPDLRPLDAVGDGDGGAARLHPGVDLEEERV